MRTPTRATFAILATLAVSTWVGCGTKPAETAPAAIDAGDANVVDVSIPLDEGIDAIDASLDTAKPDTVSGEIAPIFEVDPPDCDPGKTRCEGICVDTKIDKTNCGGCGTICADGKVCVDGKCDVLCTAPTTKCAGACTNTTFDPANCGTCGTVCGSGAKSTPFCASSKCGLTCDVGFGDCNGVAGDGCEVDLTTSNSHCGACAKPCAIGSLCVASACKVTGMVVTFPSKLSNTRAGPLGDGGGAQWFQAGDFVEESFARSTSVSKLDVDFDMSDHTIDAGTCTVGNLTWSVMLNGVSVGSYSWVGGSGGASGAKRKVTQSFSFVPVAPSGGSFVVRFQAKNDVCLGAWNWFAGGSATLQ